MSIEPARSEPSISFVIDGSNVLLSNRVGGAPSIRAFAALLAMLDREGKAFKVWFDNSIYHHVREGGADVDEFKRVIGELNHHHLLGMAPRADDGIQADCARFQVPVINGGDKNDSWRAPVPPICRCRLNLVGGRELMVYVAHAGNGRKLFLTSVGHSFQFRGLAYPALGDSDATPDIGRTWATPPKFKGRREPGSLLVLVLDASPSMDATDTFDGRSRADHVSDIVRESLSSLTQSQIGPRLQVCILSFSGDVALISPNGDGQVFSSLQGWLRSPFPDYREAVSRDWTNIRLGLDRAADLIDGFRQSDVAQQLAMNWKNATVVMLTDGEHETRIDDRRETSKDIVTHVFATLSRAEDVSFGFIGLGDKADHESLIGWSTIATPQQMTLAARKGVQLVGQRLYVKANSQDSSLNLIVRSFIDLASSRIGE